MYTIYSVGLLESLQLQICTCLALLLFGACAHWQQQAEGERQPPWEGIFVSESYFIREQGADWSVVLIDSAGYARLRYRADHSPSDCDYDFILEGEEEVKDGCIQLEKARLKGDTLYLEDLALLCKTGKQEGHKFVRLKEQLDERQLIPNVHESPIHNQTDGTFAVRQEGRNFIITGAAGLADTISLDGKQYVEYHFAEDLDNDNQTELIIALNTFSLTTEQPCQPTLIAYTQAHPRGIQRIEVEDFLASPYSSWRSSIFWLETSTNKLSLCLPILDDKGLPADSLLTVEYQLLKDAEHKKLIISGIRMEYDENCYY